MKLTSRNFTEDTIAAPVAVSEMIVDDYQGHISAKLVDKIASAWNDSAAGAVVLNLRSDNTYAVLDGQHRVLAAKKCGVTELNALVFIGKSKQEEAKLFVQLNTKHNVAPMDRFRANLVAGQTIEKNIRHTLVECGLDVAIAGPRRDGTNVQCVGTLVEIYKLGGPQHFKTIVGILASAYKDYNDTKSFTSEAFDGLSMFLSRYPKADTKRIIEKLRERSPIVMLGMSAAKRERGQKKGMGWGKALTNLYNSGYRVSSKVYLDPAMWDKKVFAPLARIEAVKRGKSSVHNAQEGSRRKFLAAAKSKKEE